MVSSKGDAGHPAAVARDTLICKAVAFAGNAIPQNRNFLESLLEKALIAGVERLEPDARSEQTGRKREQIPNWDRKVGDFDIKVWLPGESLPSILIEAKVDDVGQSLWDLFKLTSVPEIKGAVAGYLLAAAESLNGREAANASPSLIRATGQNDGTRKGSSLSGARNGRTSLAHAVAPLD